MLTPFVLVPQFNKDDFSVKSTGIHATPEVLNKNTIPAYSWETKESGKGNDPSGKLVVCESLLELLVLYKGEQSGLEYRFGLYSMTTRNEGRVSVVHRIRGCSGWFLSVRLLDCFD